MKRAGNDVDNNHYNLRKTSQSHLLHMKNGKTQINAQLLSFLLRLSTEEAMANMHFLWRNSSLKDSLELLNNLLCFVTPPVALLGLLPVPKPGKEENLGKETLTLTNELNHLNST